MKNCLFVFFLIAFGALAQTDNGNKRSFYKQAKFLKGSTPCEQALEHYKNGAKIHSPDSKTTYFTLAQCAYLLDDKKLSDKLIREEISVEGTQLNQLKNLRIFEDLKTESFYQEIVKDYNELRQEYFSNLDNIDVYLEIEELIARDQFVRKIDDYLDGKPQIDIEETLEKFEKAKKENDSVAFNKYQKILFPEDKSKYADLKRGLMIKVDSLNINRLIEITKEHGWQPKAFILLWHQRGTYGEDNYIWNHFKPLIDKAIKEHKASQTFWHLFDDHKARMESKLFTVKKE